MMTIKVSLMKKIQILFAILLAGLLATSVAIALPDHYPDQFAWSGKVSSIDVSKRKIAIGDKYLDLGIGVNVHYPNKNIRGKVEQLQIGTSVGCTLGKTGNITDLWVLSPVQ